MGKSNLMTVKNIKGINIQMCNKSVWKCCFQAITTKRRARLAAVIKSHGSQSEGLQIPKKKRRGNDCHKAAGSKFNLLVINKTTLKDGFQFVNWTATNKRAHPEHFYFLCSVYACMRVYPEYNAIFAVDPLGFAVLH